MYKRKKFVIHTVCGDNDVTALMEGKALREEDMEFNIQTREFTTKDELEAYRIGLGDAIGYQDVAEVEQLKNHDFWRLKE